MTFGLLAGVACSSDPAAVSAADDAGVDAGEVTSSAAALSPEAKIGFEESPFRIDTRSMSAQDQETVGRGSYIVNAQSDCKGCHGHLKTEGIPVMLGGGVRLVVGARDGRSNSIVYTRNLTNDPLYGLRLTEEQFIETMRTGRDFRNPGQQLLVMPWFAYRWMTDSDLKAVYAYLKIVPADPYPVPPDMKGSQTDLGPVPFGDQFTDGDVTRPLEPDDPADVGHTKRGMAIDPRAPSAAYAALSEAEKKAYARGSYIANAIADCNQCHTAPQRDLTPGSATYLKVNTAGFLAGGRYFDVATDLHPATQTRRTQCSNLSGAKNGLLKNLSYEEFRYIIKSKIFIDQNKKERLLGFPMFLQPYTKMTEDDIFAVYTYMKAQAPVEGEFDKIAQSPSRYCVSKDECKVGETCDLTSHECYGKACAVDTDCDVCQTCSVTKTCAVPDPKSTCVAKSALMY